MNLEPKEGFDWDRLTWGRPDSFVSVLCSYCSASIGDDDLPLRLWRADGSAVQFCDDCQRRWWGMESYDEGNAGGD